MKSLMVRFVREEQDENDHRQRRYGLTTLAWVRIKGNRRLKAILDWPTRPASAFRKTSKRLLAGLAWRHIREKPGRSWVWHSCTTLEGAFPKTMRKLHAFQCNGSGRRIPNHSPPAN